MELKWVLLSFMFILSLMVIVNAADCPTPISAPGTYVMSEDYAGAPYSDPIVDGKACVKITSSDVIFDCNNHYIHNNGTAGLTYGILVVSNLPVTNVTIKNCRGIYDYTDGIYFHETQNSRIEKVVSNNNGNGFVVNGGQNNTIFNNTVHSNEYGISILSSSKNIVEKNYIYSQKEGVIITLSTKNTVKDNKIYNNVINGISLTLLSMYNNLTGNTLENNGIRGVYAELASHHNYVYNNSAKGGTWGFRFTSSGNTTLIKNTASESIVGFLVEQSENCTLKNNIAIRNSDTGFAVGQLSHRTKMENNTGYGSDNGLYIDTSNNVVVDTFTTYNNDLYGIYILDSYGAQIKNVHVYNSSTEFYAESGGVTTSISVTNITIDNPNGGFVNKTVLNIFDTINNGEELAIKWVRNTYPLPPGKSSFEGKFLNISGVASINKIEWLWTLSESSGYDEESFELAKYSGSGWSRVSATLDIVLHKMTVYNLLPASIYGILGNGSTLNYTIADIYRANVTNRTSLARWSGTGEAGRANIEGGNISDLNLSSRTLTDRWAAFYGDIVGSIYLTTNAGGLSNYVYMWNWAPAYGGTVCASTNSSMLSINVTGASGRDVDGAWGFGDAADNGRNTFVGLGCDILLGSANVTGADFADTGAAGGFRTCALKTKKSPSKSNMLFCTRIDANGAAFDNTPANFEIIVPTAFGNGVFETYYFYAAFD
ncbi:MAG: right-handed parallel beta-helix repeat-containing protein [Candidatus Micrarchaeia archaeon]